MPARLFNSGIDAELSNILLIGEILNQMHCIKRSTMRLIKKAAALVCCAALIAAMCIAAVSASAEGMNEFTAAQVYTKLDTKEIPYTVKLLGENTFDYVTFKIKYDNRLKPVMQSEKTPKNDTEDFSGLATVRLDAEKCEITYSLTCSKPQTENADKNLITLFFELPKKAKQGDAYDIRFVDGETKLYQSGMLQQFTCASGWIQVNESEGSAKPSTTQLQSSTGTENAAVTTETTENQENTGLKDALGILLLVAIFGGAGFAFVKLRKR